MSADASLRKTDCSTFIMMPYNFLNSITGLSQSKDPNSYTSKFTTGSLDCVELFVLRLVFLFKVDKKTTTTI